jgi:multidrug resistance efflux pump
MSEKTKGNRSVRWAGIFGAALVAAGLVFLRTEQRIHADGIVYARTEAHVFAPADGVLQQLHVSLGQAVRAGDPLFDLDDTDLRQRALLTEKELAQMRAELAANDVALRATNVLPELEQEKLLVDRQRLQEKSALAASELSLTTNLMAGMHVVAPMDGRVVDLDYRYTGMSVPRGSRLAKLAVPDGNFRIKALVAEKNVDLIRAGTRAFMRSGVFDAVLEGYIKGRVVRVGPEGDNSAGESSDGPRYEVYIDVEETPYPLTLGSRVKVELLLGKRDIWGILFDTHRRRKVS